jgi:flagellar biogenesis protein FliO
MSLGLSPRRRFGWLAAVGLVGALLTQASDAVVLGAASNSGPEIGLSVLRLLGALATVLAIFLGGVWLFRNWSRVMPRRGPAPKLNVLEVRSIGPRHALYVVAYERERMLLAVSPSGVTLLSHWPAEECISPATPSPAASFSAALQAAWPGKS